MFLHLIAGTYTEKKNSCFNWGSVCALHFYIFSNRQKCHQYFFKNTLITTQFKTPICYTDSRLSGIQVQSAVRMTHVITSRS